MKQEDKDLLLQDLSSRLPYGVKIDIPDLFISTKNNIEVLNEIFCGDDGEFRCNDSGMLIKYVKPYLFPLSSMTEEQYENFLLTDSKITLRGVICSTKGFEFLNKHHFDYRGIISMGLAIDATGLNIY